MGAHRCSSPHMTPKAAVQKVIGLSLSEALEFCSRLARDGGAFAKIEVVAHSVSEEVQQQLELWDSPFFLLAALLRPVLGSGALGSCFHL